MVNFMTTNKPYQSEEPAVGKISETAVAAYGTYTDTNRLVSKREARMHYIAGLQASEDVWRLAKEKELVPHIETAIRLARESFGEIQEIKLTYSPDPEIPHWEIISIDLHVTGTLDELLQADQKYIRAFTTTIPDEKQFHICMQVMPEEFC